MNAELPADDESTEATFFLGKRPWSKIKDQVLGSYIKPYLSKVKQLGREILLIDAFAGPGKFEDGSVGSPLILCNTAEQVAKEQYVAMFVNEELDHHQKLSQLLNPFIEKKRAVTVHGSADAFLDETKGRLADKTVFLYLDPFGLRGCEFKTLESFLSRGKEFSTEIVINLSVPILHRLAAKTASAAGGTLPKKIESFHNRLTKVLGGDYWQQILWDEQKSPEMKADEVMAEYRKKLVSFGLPFSGSCPVREREDSGIKYYITFCSRHIDAMLLMNDAMYTAYNQRMHEADTENTLFSKSNWKETRRVEALPKVVMAAIVEAPGKSRFQLWQLIVQRHFMRYLKSDYNTVVKDLVGTSRITTKDVRGTGRLNEDTLLFPAPKPG